MELYKAFVHLHSVLRWAVLLMLVVSIAKVLTQWIRKHPHNNADRKISLITLIITHTQLIIGLILFFISPKVNFSFEVMKSSFHRFFLVEHSLLMVIAIILVTMGYSKAKKSTSPVRKNKLIFFYYLIALIIILIAIPWPFQDYGAQWL